MQGIKIHIDGQPARASDTGDNNNIVLRESGLMDGADERAQQNSIAASRAPDMGEFFVMAKILMD